MARVCLFLGAGFSKWSADLPLVSQLFDFAVDPENLSERKRLDRLADEYAAWQLANPTQHVEQFIAFAQKRPQLRKRVGWYVVRRLSDSFIVSGARRRTLYLNSYRALQHGGIKRASSLFQELGRWHQLSIVTTNYDMLPEYALSSRGFNYGVVGEHIGWTSYPHVASVKAVGDVRVSKLHGSVSWGVDGKKSADSRYGFTGNALIVPPISEKEPPAALLSQWAFASESLRQADHLIVFGFSFNDNDLAVRNLVRDNLGPAANILFVDAVDHRARLAFLTDGRRNRYLNPVVHSDLDLVREVSKRFVP